MRRLLLIAGLLAAGVTSGCDIAHQRFSCGPSLSSNYVDREQYRYEPIPDASGVPHC